MNRIKSFFYNSEEIRLRSGMRIFLFFLLNILFALLGNLIIHTTFPGAKFNESAPLLFVLLLSILQLVVVISSLAISLKFFDKDSFRAYGFNFDWHWGKNFLFGLFLGAAQMTIIFLIQLSLGWVSITGFCTSTKNEILFILPLAVCFFHFISVGISEEILFRGYLIKNLSDGFTSQKNRNEKALIQALILTSIIFGFAHAWNPDASLVSTINIMAAGILLGIGYIMTNELAIPIGLHISWNFFQGNVFGFPVSGQSNTTSIATVIQIQQKGPRLLDRREIRSRSRNDWLCCNNSRHPYYLLLGNIYQ